MTASPRGASIWLKRALFRGVLYVMKEATIRYASAGMKSTQTGSIRRRGGYEVWKAAARWGGSKLDG